jgi:O-antigen ligase
VAEESVNLPFDAQRRHPDYREAKRTREATVLEKVIVAHLGLFVVGLSWAFGGQIAWARQALLAWGTLGVAFFIVACATTHESRRPSAGFLSALRDLWPLLLFDALVGLSCFNPTFRILLRGSERFFELVDPPYAWLPSSARPGASLRELWQFNALVLSCYNIRLVLHSRRIVRVLLFVAAANALVLAVFGTFQKLAGATGLYFGLVKSPQLYFFSSFVYHNHWSAFILLHTAVCLGLLFHSLRRRGHRDLWHSPVLAGAVGILLLAATVPLSASRSGSGLIGLLLFAALVNFLVRIVHRRRAAHESAALPVAGIVAASLVAAGSILYLSRDVIAQRARLTTQQLEHLRHEDTLDSRLTLYRDTWRMAMEKPWFGWGLGTYGDAFRIFNSQRAVEVVFGQPYYREAHSDWLQYLAETGLAGTALLVALGLMPLLRTPWRRVESTLPLYLLAGCGIVLAYALVEFPFACPSVMLAFWFNLYAATRYATLDLDVRSGHPAA